MMSERRLSTVLIPCVGLMLASAGPALAQCGPGPHWIDTCVAGPDIMNTSALIGLDLNLDGILDTNLILSGPVTIQRQAASDVSANFVAGTVDGHLDVIDTEIVSMSLSSGPNTLTAGVNLNPTPGGVNLGASLGVIVEQVGDNLWADSFFEVWFEFDLGGGVYVYNQTALNVFAKIDRVPPETTYLHPIGTIDLYDAPVGGSVVARLMTANHNTFELGAVPMTAPVEWSNGRLGVGGMVDKDAPGPGGALLGPDPEQVVYTMPFDLPTPGDPWPFDTQDFGGTGEVDALANANDAFFWSVIANRVDLIVSFETDPANPPGTATYYETPGPPPPVVRAPQYLQQNLSNQPAMPPNLSDIDDVDAIEYWGPTHDGVNPLSGWDANMYSLAGDSASGTSVFFFPAPAGPSAPYVPHAAIVAAVTALGYAGASQDVDLDGLMVCDNGDRNWNFGDAILFSIRAVAGSGWHGGEIVVLRNGLAPVFLSHGGHLWDSTAPNLPSGLFGITEDEVDGIEAAPAKGQPFGCCKVGPTDGSLETEDGCADSDGKYDGDGSVCPGGPQGGGYAGIPAVSEWGLVLLVLLVLAAGTIVLGRVRGAPRAA